MVTSISEKVRDVNVGFSVFDQLSCNTLLSQWLMPPKESIREALGRHNLFQIVCNEVGNGPGRIEPRVIKRRRKPYSLMTKPRNQYK